MGSFVGESPNCHEISQFIWYSRWQSEKQRERTKSSTSSAAEAEDQQIPDSLLEESELLFSA